ncbi:MAG: DUF1003 domain-containing protein [Patescibacteria group bacterium]
MHHINSFQAKANSKRTPAERLADWMTSRFGTIQFLIINVVLFFIWILININLIPMIPSFDPFPFALLTMAVSLEAIFLAIVVLISQNRAAHIADVREEIDLQLDLITEQELTKVMHLAVYIAEHDGLNTTNDKELKQMLRQLDVDKISQLLEKQIK